MSFADDVEDQHEYSNCRDTPGALERQLHVYIERGRRVLNFWRMRGRWVFKLMVVGAYGVELEQD